MNDTRVRDQAQAGVQVMDPPFARALFGNTVWSWLWLVVRVYVGYSWISAGLEKFSNPAWMQTGEAAGEPHHVTKGFVAKKLVESGVADLPANLYTRACQRHVDIVSGRQRRIRLFGP